MTTRLSDLTNRIQNEIALSHHSAESESRLICFHLFRKYFGLQKMSDLFGVDRIFQLPIAFENELDFILRERKKNYPLQYLFSYQFFLNHEYEVNPSVLIPRPETELLVKEVFAHYPAKSSLCGLEIGLGSGIISSEILFHYPNLKMLATEVSTEALIVGEKNIYKVIGKEKATRFQSHLVKKGEIFPSKTTLEVYGLDFIVSNPPYLLNHPSEVEEGVSLFEPKVALFPEEGVNFFYKEIISLSQKILKDGGMVFVEIPHERSKEIERMFLDADFSVSITKDLSARDRVISAKKRK